MDAEAVHDTGHRDFDGAGHRFLDQVRSRRSGDLGDLDRRLHSLNIQLIRDDARVGDHRRVGQVNNIHTHGHADTVCALGSTGVSLDLRLRTVDALHTDRTVQILLDHRGLDRIFHIVRQSVGFICPVPQFRDGRILEDIECKRRCAGNAAFTGLRFLTAVQFVADLQRAGIAVLAGGKGSRVLGQLICLGIGTALTAVLLFAAPPRHLPRRH